MPKDVLPIKPGTIPEGEGAHIEIAHPRLKEN